MSTRVDIRPYQIRSRRFTLAKHDPAYLPSDATKDRAQRVVAEGVAKLRDLQEKLYAQNEWSVLLILQAMDAAGKDSAIEHVMSGVNPQGCDVVAFKAPSEEELDHDYLWRTTQRLPRRGHLGIFNRSYYEEVLIVRVHPELLDRQRLPKVLVSKRLWDERYEDIVAHERYLARNGTVIRKVFLHLSRDEQRRRFLSRLDEPEKRWKFSMQDVAERKRWDDYMHAYEEMIAATSTAAAPWYVVPADHKWWARAVISAILIETLEGLGLQFPQVTGNRQRELMRVRRALQRDGAR
jgi:PPK2 family polyphosphate:nucleotide phosphotransferase